MSRWTITIQCRRAVAVFALASLAALSCGGEKKSPAQKSEPQTVEPAPKEAAPVLDEHTGKLVFKGPSRKDALERARFVKPFESGGEVENDPSLIAYAYRFNSRIFNSAAASAATLGIFRRGTWLPVARDVTGPGCEGGRWYALDAEGYVCSSDGVVISEKPPQDAATSRAPRLDGALPYEYAQIKEPGAPRLYRVPKENELLRLNKARETGKAWPEVLDKQMIGDYFVAKDKVVESSKERLWRTVFGRYVFERDLEPMPLPPMVGSKLDEGDALPLAFVYKKQAPLYKILDGGLSHVGVAQKHVRFFVDNIFEEGGRRFVARKDGLAVPRDDVRLARRIPRPDRVPEGQKWIHVDLSEQTLVAYEPSAPVYATVVSSGKPGYDTPRGTFRIRKKFLSITMNGHDPKEGTYDVGEVPWTMYYFKSYALHGAYWHNDFGVTRSHGCTNIAPADAKWLFYWTSPKLPKGWHGVRLAEGTYVHLTRSAG